MKKHLLFLLFLSNYCLSEAQVAWDLFPTGQKTWCQSSDKALHLFYNDSTEVIGADARRHYFGEKYIAGYFGDCFWELLLDPSPALPFNPPVEYFNPMMSNAGNWRFDSATEPVIFKSNALPGDSWVFPVTANGAQYSSLNIECISMDTIQVFGNMTAAKYFRLNTSNSSHPLNGFVFTLTEKFGLIHYVSLIDLKEGQNSLIYDVTGFEKNGLPHGTAPSFQSFFGHYAPGDLYKWKSESVDYFMNRTVRIWRLDSITNVFYASGTVQITATTNVFKVTKTIQNGQTIIDTTIFTIPQTSMAYQQEEYESILAATPDWYSPSNYFAANLLESQGTFEDDGKLSISADLTKGSFNANTCSMGPTIDFSSRVKVHEQFGLTYVSSALEGGTDYQILIGARQNGVIWGDIDALPTVSVAPPPLPSTLDLHPNPTAGTVVLDLPDYLPQNKQYDLEIIDMQGKTVYLGTYLKYTPVDMSALEKGLYCLKLRDRGFIGVGRVLKL